MKPQDKQHRFLQLDREAQRRAVGLAAETEFQHPDPLGAGESIPMHSHPEDNIYYVTGSADFTVFAKDGKTMIENCRIGDGQAYNAVFIPGGMNHGWTNAVAGTRIWDVQYEERVEKMMEPALACA